MVYSTRRFVVCLSVCHFVLVFFSPFSIAITSLGEERANLSAFRPFVRFVLVWICRFPLPLGIWEELRFVILALLGLSSYLFFFRKCKILKILSPVLVFIVYYEGTCSYKLHRSVDLVTQPKIRIYIVRNSCDFRQLLDIGAATHLPCASNEELYICTI